MRNRIALIALAAVLVLGLCWWWKAAHGGALVVYCAHDAIYAEKILRDFEKRTGTPLVIRFDTEATKSLGLAELLIREKDAPRCDVFWNNEQLGMLDLQERGILQPYQGPGYARIPAKYKAPDGSWTGFAARLRVVIFNTAKIGTTPPNLIGLLPGTDMSRIAIAKPLYGTTLTHYTLLWHQWGAQKLQGWHSDWRGGGVKELNGNAAVKDAVADGACFAGFTDTDDYFEAKDDGRPVAMTPVRLDDGKTICIPNTVAIIRGARHTRSARKLVDFLLSEETELALASSKSRQIPLGPVPAERLPAEVRDLAPLAGEGADLNSLGAARAECLAWLKSLYAP
ncbi:MAG TPA: extracellular solute-binding protein [Chthoniobacter sp.]|nr:extracellular solute-binding protein [Chthoniobacter sp.]